MSVDETPKDEVVADAEAVEAKVAEATEAAEATLEEAADELAKDVAELESVTDAAEEQLEDDGASAEATVAVEEFAAEVKDEALETAREAEAVVEDALDDPRPAPKPAPTPKSAPKPNPKAAPERKKRERKPAVRQAAPAKPAGVLDSLGIGAWIGIAVAALVLGIVIGKFLLGGGAAAASGSLTGKFAVSESELDMPVATYTYKGNSTSLTAREVILQNSSLDSAMDAEGNYILPSAETVLSVARNAIVRQEAESRGLTVSDEELAAYSEQTLGSSDYASIAASYGMTEDAVKDLLTNSCLMSKLRDEVVDTTVTATMPDAPTAPTTTTEMKTQYNEETGEEEQVEVEVDNSEVPTAEYAAYIIGLAGDEWDAEAGTWASTDGPYASTLAGYEITKDSATYEAAQAAYYVAYQQYSEAQTTVSTQWSDFVNGLLSNASIQISTLVA